MNIFLSATLLNFDVKVTLHFLPKVAVAVAI